MNIKPEVELNTGMVLGWLAGDLDAEVVGADAHVGGVSVAGGGGGHGVVGDLDEGVGVDQGLGHVAVHGVDHGGGDLLHGGHGGVGVGGHGVGVGDGVHEAGGVQQGGVGLGLGLGLGGPLAVGVVGVGVGAVGVSAGTVGVGVGGVAAVGG